VECFTPRGCASWSRICIPTSGTTSGPGHANILGSHPGTTTLYPGTPDVGLVVGLRAADVEIRAQKTCPDVVKKKIEKKICMHCGNKKKACFE